MLVENLFDLAYIKTATYSDDGSLVATSTGHHGIMFWNAESGEKITHVRMKEPYEQVGLGSLRFLPDGKRIAFLYSEGAPKTPGPLNPLTRDAGVLSSTVYEQRLAVVPAHGGEPTLLGPADLLKLLEDDETADDAGVDVSERT